MSTPSFMRPAGPVRSRLAFGEAFVAWLVARVVVGIGYAAADAIASVLELRDTLHLQQKLITWDGTFYWAIANGGYDSVAREGLRFFPFYPGLAKILAWPLGGRVGLTLVLVSNAAAYVCLLLLRRLVEEETGDVDLARRSMWLLAVFPAAGIFVLAYGESVALAASLVAFLFIRRDRWWWAAGFGAVAGLTRPVGVLLIVPFAIEAWLSRGRGGSVLSRLAAIASPVVGALMYLFWVGGEYGDWLEPVRIQRELRDGFQDPFTRLWDGVHTFVTTSQLDAPNLVFALGFIALLIVAIRTQRVAWWAYAAVTLVVALSAVNIDSIGRYGLMAFPFVVALARVSEDERVMWGVLTLCGTGLAALTVMSTLGVYTP